MTSGSPLQLALFMMSLCKHMQTSLLMKLSSSVWQRYQFTFISILILKEQFHRLRTLSNGTFSTTYLPSVPLLLPCSRMSSDIILTVSLKMSRIHWSGGTRTSLFIPDSLEWHWTTYQYQVCNSATISRTWSHSGQYSHLSWRQTGL